MNIILDARTATDHFPGVGRYVVNLAGALQRVAPELDLALLRDPSVTAQRLTLPELPTLACAVSPFAPAQQWRVRQALHGIRAALYHSPFYLMPYRPGVPAVFTCHDLIPLVFPHYYTARQRLIYRLTHQLALNTAQRTIAISQSTKRDLQRFFRVNPDRIVVVHEGVDAHFQPSSRVEIDRVKQYYALPDRYVLYFGSNKPHKNLARLVAAFSRLRPLAADFHLVIAGSWDARYDEAKRLAANNDHIRFLGPVRDVDLPALYSSALAFAFVSEYEGFGLPPLEAMACGTPVIASNTSSLPEVMGEAGLLVDPHDVSAIAAALDRVVSDAALRADLKQRSLDRAAAFTWEQTAAQTMAVYRTLIGAG